MLRGTTVLRVVMNSNQRGVNGKRWVLPVTNLNKYLSNLNKYKSGIGTDSSLFFPGMKPEGLMVNAIAVNGPMSREMSEAKGHFPVKGRRRQKW